MRITDSYKYSLITGYMMDNTQTLSKLQAQASTGKKIMKPSDDPTGLNAAMSVNSDLSDLDQYSSNITNIEGFAQITESTLNNMTDALNQLKSIAIQAGNGNLDDTTKSGLISQVNSIKEKLVSLGNTKYSDQYIFGGSNTTTQPFVENSTDDTVQYNGNASNMKVQVGINTMVNKNVSGTEVTTIPVNGQNIDLFKMVSDIGAAISSGDVQTVSSKISGIDAATRHITSLRSDTGTNLNIIDFNKNRIEDLKTTFTNQYSSLTDADITQTVMDLQSAENVYNSSMLAASRMMQTSLTDYLR